MPVHGTEVCGHLIERSTWVREEAVESAAMVGSREGWTGVGFTRRRLDLLVDVVGDGGQRVG